MNKYTVCNMRNMPSLLKQINYPNIALHSSNPNVIKHPKHHCIIKYKSYQPEEPNHILFFFNNSQSLKKIKYLRQRINEQPKLLTDKQTNEGNTTREERIEVDKIINPFLIKNYSKKHNPLFSSLKKSQSSSFNLNNIGYKTISKIPSMFNGYVTRSTRFSPSELFQKNRYSKPKINIKAVLLNQKANQINHTKSRLKLFQMKQSIHLYKNEKNLINRYKTCAVFNK